MISNTSSPYSVIEGETATLMCTVTDVNPHTGIAWRWIKTDSPNTVLHNGPNYIIYNIQRPRSGAYNCTASNVVGISQAAIVYVNVQCKLFIYCYMMPFITKLYETVLRNINSVYYTIKALYKIRNLIIEHVGNGLSCCYYYAKPVWGT